MNSQSEPATDVGAHVVVCGGSAPSLLGFRRALLDELLARNCKITAIAAGEDRVTKDELARLGIKYLPLNLSVAGLNLFADIRSILALAAILRVEKPNIFMGYTIKPALYGVLAARLAGVNTRVAMIEGLGYAFTPGRELTRKLLKLVAWVLFVVTLPFATRVVVLNRDDREFFLRSKIVRPDRLVELAGIGMDLKRFTAQSLPRSPVSFLMISRLLKDKGVADYVEAARIVRARRPDLRFVLVGPDNLTFRGFSAEDAKAWHDAGWVEYLGGLTDVRPALAAAHIYVLPSHREGFPVSVMEAAAIGRGAVVTDVPGCREVVIEGETGRLVPPHDPQVLAKVLLELADDLEAIKYYGKKARERAVKCFSAVDRARDLADILLQQK